MLRKSNQGIYKLSLFIIGVLLFAASCKKDPKAKPDPTPNPNPVTATREELTKDSIYLYAKETYYWNDVLPSYEVFKPRGYAGFQEVLGGFTKIKIDPTTNKAIDKYSFLDDGSVAGELGGQGGDYGFSVFYNDANSGDLRIKYVYENSPASSQELKRGYQITKINNRTDLVATAATLDFVSKAVFGSNASISLTLKKPDGSSVDVTVTRGQYSINPILFSKVYEVGAKKVGYIVFNSFTTNSATKLDAIFTEFTTAGISEVIVDLRYNGGGSVSTADVLTNLIAPSAKTGTVMYTTFWTKTMQDGAAKILAFQPLLDNAGKLQPYTQGVNGKYATFADLDYRPLESADNVEKFAKRGATNITRAYFIVSSSTASASELVINNLKPVMDVKLIGRKTYGKPVGFFAIGIDKLDMYIPQFETKNSLNQGGYFAGMAVDKDIFDDVTKDFGDPAELLLANALSYADKGSFLAVKPGGDRISSSGTFNRQEVERVNNQLDENEFKGMVETRRPKLKK